jgi:hypothetical protein
MEDIKPVPKGPEVITSTVGSDESAVKAVRNEIPIGVSGHPVERIPWGPKIEGMVQAGIFIKRIASQERCLRPVEVPLKGGIVGKFACSRPCVSVGTDGDKYCPEHDREAFQPIQDHKPTNQIVFNSASIELTEAERQVTYEKDGKKYTVAMQDGNDVTKGRAAREPELPVNLEKIHAPKRLKPHRQSVQSSKGDNVKLTFSLDELKSDHIGETFVIKAIAALDALPAKNIAQMKAIVEIQEYLKELGGGD